MEIKSYKKLHNNLYEVYIDDLKVKLYDDIILKYNLLLNKKIDQKTFSKIMTENESLEAYYRALKYLNIKLRSEKEIVNYLKKLNISDHEVLNTIVKLKNDGYLNNSLYLKSYINDQVNLSMHGPYKIKNSLLNLGFKEPEIDIYLDKIDRKVWENKIKRIIAKRKKLNKKGNLKEKTYLYLYNLGYENSMIYNLLGDITEY